MRPLGRSYLGKASPESMGLATEYLIRLVLPMANCTWWSHGDPYVWGRANSKVIET